MKTCVSIDCPFISFCKAYNFLVDRSDGCDTQNSILKAAEKLAPRKSTRHRKSRRRFTWDAWDFDCSGAAYVIAKDECPDKNKVSDYIIAADHLAPECKPDMVIQEGWCKWMIRRDWNDCEGESVGGYCVELRATRPAKRDGSPARGWFPVWVIRKEDWY